MVKKKLAIIGADHIAALELIYKRNLEQHGYIVAMFAAQNLFLDYYNSSLINKVLCRLGLSGIIRSIQLQFKIFIDKFDPNIVVVFKGMEIIPASIDWMKKRGILVVNYNPDHPFIFSGRGSGNNYVKNSISLFHCYISYDEDAVRRLNSCDVMSYKIPFGFDQDGFEYKQILQEEEIVKACFVGNADQYRVDFINKLAEFGLAIDVYGDNWCRFRLASSITVGPSLYGQAFWTTLNRYALQLNYMRPHNSNSHNMRSFDIPGAGAIMLAPNTNDHRIFFDEGDEVFLFDDFHDALEKANFILKMTFQERLRIRRNARKKSMSKHTYHHRVFQLINILESYDTAEENCINNFSEY